MTVVTSWHVCVAYETSLGTVITGRVAAEGESSFGGKSGLVAVLVDGGVDDSAIEGSSI